MGIAWMIGEDIVDRYLIKGIENRCHNKTVRALARSMLNPTRSYANILRFKVPWMRDDRPNVGAYRSIGSNTPFGDLTGPKFDHREWPAGAAFDPKTLEIVLLLARGVDPDTRERLPFNGSYHRPRMAPALLPVSLSR
jgi:hypothetical protein